MTRAEAISWLTIRWHEQCERYPLMREDIPLALYIQRNVGAVLANARMRKVD
jgi:hypothetical protein